MSAGLSKARETNKAEKSEVSWCLLGILYIPVKYGMARLAPTYFATFLPAALYLSVKSQMGNGEGIEP